LAEAGGICVSSRVQEDAKGSLSRLGIAFEDLGQHQLKNIDHAVHIYRVLLDHAATTAKSKQAPKSAPALPDKPSIAVLAFTNLSGDPQKEYFADGIADDIITELSRFSELFVIACNSSFQYKGKAVDVREIGRALGVRYVLEGSMRLAGDRIRIAAQLADAATGAHLWAERYDRKLEDVSDVQDEVVRTMVSILAAHVSKAEAERALLKPAVTWQAYDYCLRATEVLASYWTSAKQERVSTTHACSLSAHLRSTRTMRSRSAQSAHSGRHDRAHPRAGPTDAGSPDRAPAQSHLRRNRPWQCVDAGTRARLPQPP
jgi:adenylate cyclase